MNKKDYERIAAVIKDAVDVYSMTGYDNYDAINTLRKIVDKLSFTFSDDNPRFNKDIFLEACGLK